MSKTETIRVRANQQARTFTIRKYIDGALFAKYRTNPVSREEFETDEYNTESDWAQYLKSSNDYYKVN